MTTVSSLVEINQQQAEQIKQLNAGRDKWCDEFAKIDNEANILTEENARLRAALEKIKSDAGNPERVWRLSKEALKGQP